MAFFFTGVGLKFVVKYGHKGSYYQQHHAWLVAIPLAGQPHSINQNGAHLYSRFVLLSDPSAMGAGPQRSQPEHASNPHSVIPTLIPI